MSINQANQGRKRRKATQDSQSSEQANQGRKRKKATQDSQSSEQANQGCKRKRDTQNSQNLYLNKPVLKLNDTPAPPELTDIQKHTAEKIKQLLSEHSYSIDVLEYLAEEIEQLLYRRLV